MLKLGLAPYINAYPFRSLFNLNALPYELTIAPPRALNQSLLEGELDLALCSSALLVENRLDYLPSLGVCSKGPIGSVFLIKEKNLPLDKMRVKSDPESLTANTLFQVLASHFWEIPAFFEETTYNSYIKIGKLPSSSEEDWDCIDLGEIWTQFTKLPFVFALFLFHPQSFNEKQSAFELCQRSLNFSLESFYQSFEKHLALYSKLSNHSSQLLKQYYHLCHYRLSQKHLKGLHLFLELAKSCHVCSHTT